MCRTQDVVSRTLDMMSRTLDMVSRTGCDENIGHYE